MNQTKREDRHQPSATSLQTALERWRSLDAVVVLREFADYAKKDESFKPVKATTTSRWHASVFGTEVELLLTGPKFWDSRARVGGGGAIDLVMYLAQTDFKTATRMLRERQL